MRSDSIPPDVTQLGSVNNVGNNRTRKETGVKSLRGNDPYGRTAIVETRGLLAERRLRKWASARNSLFYRAKNGIYDPITYFHLVEELASLQMNEHFTAGDLTDWLNEHKPVLFWDSVVVGRILNDLIDNFAEANPGQRFQPIVSTRFWNGRHYFLTGFPEARAALFNLIDDLAILGQRTMEEQGRGEYAPRTASPLLACPSLNLTLPERPAAAS